MTDTLFNTDPTTPPAHTPGQRLAFTGEGRHWHGTVTRNVTLNDGSPRLAVDVDPNNQGINSVVYRLGAHFRPTVQGETCPDCGIADRGKPLYSRP